MTVLDPPRAEAQGDEAQLLFQEARERRRRRWARTGIIVAIAAVLLALVMGIVLGTSGGGSVKPTGPSNAAPAATHSAVSFSIRPVLCYAPPLTLATGVPATEGPLPTCSTSSQLTASNLNVNTSTGQITTTPPPDAHLSSYASTPPGSVGSGDTVLLSGAPGQGSARFLLGPAGLTKQSITSVRAADVHGQWVLDLTLSATGSRQWDSLSHQQFHAVVGVVINGKVISAPIVEPAQASFSTFGGHLQIDGEFTGGQAKSIAAGL